MDNLSDISSHGANLCFVQSGFKEVTNMSDSKSVLHKDVIPDIHNKQQLSVSNKYYPMTH